jgi:hypothetical protein
MEQKYPDRHRSLTTTNVSLEELTNGCVTPKGGGK